MKIKTRLQISRVFLMCVVLAIGLTLFFTSQRVNEALIQHSATHEIVESAFELNMLTGNYLMHQEERIISQWYIKHDYLSNHLTGLVFRNFEDQSFLDKIRQNHEDIKDFFSQLIVSYEGEGTNGEESSFREILVAQLSVKLQDIVSDATLLSETSQERLLTASQTSNLLIIFFVIAMAATIGANSVLLLNSIAKPITRLHEGVEKIADGNLNYKVGITSEDEIGQLSRAFDQMTEDLKARTEKLKEYSENLEKMVEERTKELRDTQEELLRKEKLAVLGQLAGGVAHELRNPLGVINNSSYFLNMKLKNIADEKVLKHLKIIAKTVNSANIIISDLLDFARKRKLTLKETNINFIIKNAISSVIIPEKIEVITKLEEIPLTLLDGEQIKRVFQNMILNAVQAMPEGGKLTIKTVKHENSVKIVIKDTGIGIPKENITKLFTPLFSTKAKGVGLGLTICKQIVEDHGGDIIVKSKVGGGSSFTVNLPIRIEEDEK